MVDSETSLVGDPTPSSSVRTAIEVAIRLGAIALLVGWCLMIVAPFLGIVIWALIIAIAFDQPFEAACRMLGGRRALAATIGITTILLLLFVPIVTLSETLITGAQQFAADMNQDTLHLPRPDERIKDWPVIGDSVYQGWVAASDNLGDSLRRLAPQLQAVSRWLLRAVGGVGAGILQLIASVFIAGVMLVRSDARRLATARFADRMAGPVRGAALVELANSTVRSVVQGILGVAGIQALLAGAGFLAAGIPGAGLWAALVLVFAVIQLPVFLVMIPPVVFGFSMLGDVGAWSLLIWCLAVGLVDNVLKPILFGRGTSVPMLVIFMGAIGGMLTMGLVGLFLGAVVLALGFELLMAWIAESETETAVPPTS